MKLGASTTQRLQGNGTRLAGFPARHGAPLASRHLPHTAAAPAHGTRLPPAQWSSKYGDSVFADLHEELQSHPAW